MILYKEISWWYWAVTAALLIVGVCDRFQAFYIATILGAVQVVHFAIREGSFGAFPVQVRLAFTALLLVALLDGMHWLFWLPAIAAPAQVLLGYCALARCLSLLPWNRQETLSWHLVRRAFLSRPVKGNILQGLPSTS